MYFSFNICHSERRKRRKEGTNKEALIQLQASFWCNADTKSKTYKISENLFSLFYRCSHLKQTNKTTFGSKSTCYILTLKWFTQKGNLNTKGNTEPLNLTTTIYDSTLYFVLSFYVSHLMPCYLKCDLWAGESRPHLGNKVPRGFMCTVGFGNQWSGTVFPTT